jgi:hypothetical protein
MKTKTLLFTVALVLSVFFSKAQQIKYQFMVMEYSTMDNEVAISIDGKEFKKEKINKEKHEKSGYNANPLLEKVSEYQDAEWELMSFNTQIGGSTFQGGSGNNSEIYFAYLRKKKE